MLSPLLAVGAAALSPLAVSGSDFPVLAVDVPFLAAAGCGSVFWDPLFESLELSGFEAAELEEDVFEDSLSEDAPVFDEPLFGEGGFDAASGDLLWDDVDLLSDDVDDFPPLLFDAPDGPLFDVELESFADEDSPFPRDDPADDLAVGGLSTERAGGSARGAKASTTAASIAR